MASARGPTAQSKTRSTTSRCAKKLYRSVDELQTDLDAWRAKYNAQRPHSGRYCYGKTPLQTFRETFHIAVEKTIKTHDPSDSAHPVLGVES